MGPFKDIAVDLDKDMVATIEIRRPPHNFFDIDLIRQIAEACEALDKDDKCRAIVLAAQLIFGALFGFLGLLLADPIMATLKVTLEKLAERRSSAGLTGPARAPDPAAARPEPRPPAEAPARPAPAPAPPHSEPPASR